MKNNPLEKKKKKKRQNLFLYGLFPEAIVIKIQSYFRESYFQNLNLDKKFSAEWIKKTGSRLSGFEASQYSEKYIEILVK